jgi:hypothetical protein
VESFTVNKVSQKGNVMKTGKFASRYLTPTCVAAVSLVSALCIQSAVAAPAAQAAADVDAAARASWTTFMSKNTASEAGCFQAEYPSYLWEKVACTVASPLVHPVRKAPKPGSAEVTGNGNDYVAQSSGLTSEAVGSFPTVTGVTSEKSVGVAAFGDGGILGNNEYSLQVNTNFTGTTSVCAGHSGCTVWQQFIYAPDYAVTGQAAVFIQYWLIGWGSSRCPSGGWGSDGEGDCFRNSAIKTAPDEPITSLGSFTLSGTAVAGGNDTVTFTVGSTAYSLSAADSVTDISAVWKQTEFNIVGNAGGSRATFNKGASVTVKVALTDGSTAAPTCVADSGSTGETNNLNLGSCTASSGTHPTIQFTESD